MRRCFGAQGGTKKQGATREGTHRCSERKTERSVHLEGCCREVAWGPATKKKKKSGAGGCRCEPADLPWKDRVQSCCVAAPPFLHRGGRMDRKPTRAFMGKPRPCPRSEGPPLEPGGPRGGGNTAGRGFGRFSRLGYDVDDTQRAGIPECGMAHMAGIRWIHHPIFPSPSQARTRSHGTRAQVGGE